MSEIKAQVVHIGGIAFRGISGTNHEFIMDTPNADSGGQNKGATPKEYVLAGLAGCTAMDVVSIMKKMKIEFSAFAVDAVTTTTNDHPKTFDKIILKYIVHGQNIDREKVLQAINLSMTKYCGVSAMLSKSASIHHELEIVNE